MMKIVPKANLHILSDKEEQQDYFKQEMDRYYITCD